MGNGPKETMYPFADLSIACPAASDRLTVFFRIVCAIPVLFLLCLVVGFTTGKGAVIGGGFLFLPLAAVIVFRKRYPRVWFDWICYLSKFSVRVASYVLFLRDEYPSIDDDQQVKLDLRYPDAATELHRGMPLVKWLLAVPHYVVLAVLSAAAIFVTMIAWFMVLFTGRYPPSLHDFVVAVMRWSLRVNAYAFLLLTDRYPPFKL